MKTGKTPGSLLRRLKGRLRTQKGLALVESVIAVAVLGSALVAFVTALSTGSIGVREAGLQLTAQQVARTQLEYIKGCSFTPGATGYPAADVPEGYAVSVVVTAVSGGDGDIQKISVTVRQEGEDLLTVEGYKVNR